MGLRTYKSRRNFLIGVLCLTVLGISFCVFSIVTFKPKLPKVTVTVESNIVSSENKTKMIADINQFSAIWEAPCYSPLISKAIAEKPIELPVVLLKLKRNKTLRVQDKQRRKSARTLRVGGRSYLGVQLVEIIDDLTVKLKINNKIVTAKVGSNR